MNKKFLSAILFGALMVTSTGTFVSCKDYDDDIETVQGQVDANKSALTALDAELANLKSAAAAAQSTADAAKAAAAAAKTAGDAAAAAAAEAKAAAAQAKADAIADAAAKVEAVKAWVAEQGYATQEELAVALAIVGGQIEGIEGGLSELVDYAKGLEEQLGTLSATTLSNIVALQEDVEAQKAAIDELKKSTTDEALAAQLEDLLVLVSELQANVGQAIGNLGNRLDDVDATLLDLVAKSESQDADFALLSQVVNTLVEDVDVNKSQISQIDELWAEINGEGANSIRTQLGQLANTIATVQGELATLHTLVDSSLTSLAFIPEVINTHGLGVVEFYTLELKDAAKKTVYVSNVPTATYRVNPTTTAQADYTWSFINRAVETRAAGDATDLLTITKSEAAAGSRKFWLQVNQESVNKLKAGQSPIFALKAAKGEREIVSDYATATVKTLKEFALALLDEDGEKDGYLVATEKEAKDGAAVAKMVYTSTLDLKPIVEAWSTTKEVEKALADINVEGIEYKFTEIEKYLGADGVTDQQEFVTLENGVVAVDKTWLNKGTAAIGRTPVIKAVATVNGLEIATGYIKIEIIEKEPVKPVVKEDLVITVDLKDIDYTDIKNGGNTYKLSWTDANAKIYDVLGLTKETFADKYTVNGFGAAPAAGVKVSANIDKYASTTETAFAEVVINNKVKFGKDFAMIIIESKNRTAYPNVAIKFTYNIVHTQNLPELNADYLIAANTIQVKGKMVDGSWKLISEMKEHFAEYLKNYKEAGNHSKLFFRMKKETPAQTGAEISTGDYKTQTIKLTKELDITEDYRDYNVQAVLTLANGEECVKDYVVRFVRPFNATVGAMTLKTFVATADTKDLAELVVIKDLDEKVVYEKGKYTEYGKETYKLDKAGIDFKYGFNADDTFGGKLTIKDSKITWDNGGADLQKDKTAKSEVTINIPAIATIKVEGVITVLSTEHSK